MWPVIENVNEGWRYQKTIGCRVGHEAESLTQKYFFLEEKKRRTGDAFSN